MQLPGSERFYTQMEVHTATQNYGVILAQEFQKHLSNSSLKHGVLYHGKHKKGSIQKNCKIGSIICNIIEYFEHQNLKMYCELNQFPSLQFLDPHNKIHVVHSLGKNFHMYFDSKLGYGMCEIHHIPCACPTCTSMLDQTWDLGMPEHQQPRFQPVKYFT